MDNVKLINYMENLRYERNLTQEEYLFDVVSQRQYYRYRKGESEIPLEIIDKLANKLKIPYSRLIQQYMEEIQKGKKLVQEYFNLVINKKSKEAETLFTRISNKNLIDDDSKTLAKMGKILCDYHRGFYAKIELVTLLKEHMKYDELMKCEALHDFEIYLLGLVMEYSEPDREKTLDKLIHIFEQNKVLSGGNIVFNLQVLFWIVKNLGKMKKYIDLIRMSQYAIDYANDGFSVYCLEYFHYYKALAHFRTEDKISFSEELYKAIIICMYQAEDRRDKFFSTILKDTNINAYEFIKTKCIESTK